MNQGRIWCVVNPTVGLPLFLGGVATISLIVHASVLTNTTWMADFFNGGSAAQVSLNDTTSPVALAAGKGEPGVVITVAKAPEAAANGGSAFVITVNPTTSTVTSDSLASADAPAIREDKLALALPDAN